MTKKKALVYLLIAIISISVTAFLNYFFLRDKTKNFAKECQPAIAPSCQSHIDTLTKSKKFTEAITILQERKSENEQILRNFKRKINNKNLLKMNAKDATDTLLKCAEDEKCKMDFMILGAMKYTINDIVLDSRIIAQIEINELKQQDKSQKILEKAIKFVEKQEYYSNKEQALKVLQNQLEETKNQNIDK